MPAINAAAAMQLANGRLRHLLTLEQLPAAVVLRLLKSADRFAGRKPPRLLAGMLFVNIFFENSTRTRGAFEAAARQLGADVVNLDQITMSGRAKGESLKDTVLTVSAMNAVGIGLRHSRAGAALDAARAAPSGVAILNGGDGNNAHPTQGLTDAYTLRERFGDSLAGATIAIVGDILHSRVARSDAHVFSALGATDIRLVGPPSLCPAKMATILPGRVVHNMDEGIDGADAVVLLRLQRERAGKGAFPDGRTYFRDYGLSARRLKNLLAKNKDAIVMHPGPINRGVEIADSVADGAHAKILRQVKNGMAVRMAILAELCARRKR